MTTLAGYISDTRCPSNPEHGKCWDQANGLFCPHAEHHTQGTKFFWSFDEWETAKSHPSPADATQTLRTRVAKLKKRATKRNKR